MSDEAEEFWSAFESETGEKVEARCMGEYFKGGGTERGMWGLLILTDRSFRFKYMPSENWILSLFKRPDKSSLQKKAFEIVIPRGDIVDVVAPKRDFLSRIFGPAFPRLSVVYRSEEGDQTHSFSVDPNNGIVSALEKVSAAAKAGAR